MKTPQPPFLYIRVLVLFAAVCAYAIIKHQGCIRLRQELYQGRQKTLYAYLQQCDTVADEEKLGCLIQMQHYVDQLIDDDNATLKTRGCEK